MREINRIRISAGTNGSSQVRYFATTKRLAATLYTGHHTYYLKDVEALQSGKECRPLSDDVSSVIADILKVNGIVSIVLHTYDLVIEIAMAFNWDGLQEDVLRIIKQNLFNGVSVSVQDNTESAPTTSP